MKVGEANSAAWVVGRANGFGAGIMVACSAGIILFAIAASTVLGAITPPGVMDALWPVLVVAMWIGSIFVLTRLRVWRLRRALAARGVALMNAVSFTVEDAALVIDMPMAVVRVLWPGVTEMIPTKTHWVFLTNGMGYCLPRRFFAVVDDERAFVRVALAHMSESARGRSGKAATFVAWE